MNRLSLTNIKNGINPIIIGAILTAVAFVIADSWGQAIKKSVNLLTNKIRCSKIVNYNEDNYNKCLDDNSLLGLYINAFLTTIIVYLIVRFFIGKNGIKKIKNYNTFKKR
tara:strand:- start:1953 stop:2282 length:330 start_codon:yes stop_codon:yes gene_type:complete